MIKKIFFVLMVVIAVQCGHAQGVSINEAGVPADSSAMLDVNGHLKGVLVPRLTSGQRDSIVKPATALLIFNSDLLQFQVNIGSAVAPSWRSIVSVEEPGISKQAWLTSGNQNNDANAFVGTTDKQPLLLKTNSLLRIYIDSVSGKIGINTQQPRTSVDIHATDALIVPVGTTAERPSAPVVGMIRFNASTGKLEGFTTGGWVALH